MICFKGQIQRFWPYRSAFAETQVQLDLEDFDIKILKRFVEENGYRMDNHISFELESGLYCTYSDHKLYISSTIIEGKW